MSRVYILASVDEDRFDELCTCNDFECYGAFNEKEVQVLKKRAQPLIEKEIFKKENEIKHLQDKCLSLAEFFKAYVHMLKAFYFSRFR